MKIGVIGCGVIAQAAIEGIAQDEHMITVSRRGAEHATALSDRFENVSLAGNQDVLDQSEVVLIGLMAEVAADVLGALEFRDDQRVISFMAGASLAEVSAMVAPAQATAVMIPFPGIAQGGSPILVLGDGGLVTEIFGARNSVFVTQNAQELASYLSAQAVLSPVVRMVGDAATWMGPRVENAEQGEEFLRLLVSSSLANSDCAALIKALNTEGGFNQRLRLHMEECGMRETLAEGLNKLG